MNTITWGFTTIFEMISAFVGLMYVMYVMSLYLEFIGIVIVYISVYYLIISKLEKKFDEFKKESRKIQDRIYDVLSLKFPMFRMGKANKENILYWKMQSHRNGYNIQQRYSIIATFTDITGKIILVFVLIGNYTGVKYVMVFNVIRHTIGTIRDVMRFRLITSSSSENFDEYMDMWKDVKYVDKSIEDLDIPNTITVINVNIEVDDFRLTSKDELTITKGGKYLITGKKGSGKSLFIHGLTGKIGGVEFDVNKPENYYHVVSEYLQNIKSNIQTNRISL